MAVRIIVDSACDIEGDKVKELGLDVLPIKIMFGTEEYLDGVNLGHKEFYEKLVESDKLPTTSQIPPFEYEQKFREIKEAGDEAVCITLSSKLSGCYQSANIASADYEDCVTIVDSNNVSIGEQILTLLAVQLRDEGKTASEIVSVLEEEKGKIRVIALLDTLEYLKKGGRISATVAMAGSILSIKPVIGIENGEVAVLGKARGSKNGNNMLKEMIKKEGGVRFSMPYTLAYTGLSDALLLKYLEDSADLYDCNPEDIPVSTIGSAIGTHAGPGAIGVAFFVQ